MKFLPACLLSLTAIHVEASPYSFPGSVTSWAKGQLDLFFYDEGITFHKRHPNTTAGWNKNWDRISFPILKTTSRLKSVSWGEDRVDLFGIGVFGLYHAYLSGSTWSTAELISNFLWTNTIAVSTWGTGHIDVVGKGSGTYYWKYYDNGTWVPPSFQSISLGDDGFEGQTLESNPAIVSWGPNRTDVFGILTNGTLLHKYLVGWTVDEDGNKVPNWKPSSSGWEQWGDGLTGNPVATSWGANRLDVWAIQDKDSKRGPLAHRYWDGHSLSELETLGGRFYETPAVSHWSENRIDIFGYFSDSIVYKYWDGYQWNPTDDKAPWYEHGPDGIAEKEPMSITWGPDNVQVFTRDEDFHIRHQLWDGSQWIPKVNNFSDLGNPYKSQSPSAETALTENRPFVVQDQENNLDL